MRGKILGVILAAGKGSRMYPFTERCPKPILPVCNRPLLAFQVESMAELGIADILVVIGRYGFEIVRALGDGQQFGVRLHYYEQDSALGIASALRCLEPFIDRPFLLFLGDIFFVTHDLGRMMDVFEREELRAVLATKIETDREAIRRNFSVHEGPDGLVTRVIEKPRYVEGNLKGCGLYLFDQHIFDAIRRTPRTAMRDEYELTDSIQILLDWGFAVKALPVVEDDMNLTCPDDLLRINLAQLERQGMDVLVGAGCGIHPGARIAKSVLGDRVNVAYAANITESVVFPDSELPRMGAIHRRIISPEHVISCAEA